MLYFAYGSNLDWNQMRRRCPSAKFVCVARLADHCLAFTRKSSCRGCGVADAVPQNGHEVWGVVYETPETEIGELDQAEGFKPGRTKNAYVREQRHVLADGDEGKPMAVWVYFASRQKKPPPPSVGYKKLIVDGANFWHLPSEYIEELEKIEAVN